MDVFRRLWAVVIAISLFLPLSSCTEKPSGAVTIFYPLSGDLSDQLLIAALYLLPLVVLFFARHRAVSLVIGMMACLAGLYCISYGHTLFATQLLAGWYSYTAGALLYLVSTALQLGRIGRARWRTKNSLPAPAVSGATTD